jgi:hypothetical protein
MMIMFWLVFWKDLGWVLVVYKSFIRIYEYDLSSYYQDVEMSDESGY